MKKYVKASYESKFWDLHESDMEIGIKLEDIIDDYGLSSAFFPDDGEPTADESDYKMVLEEYESNTPDSEKHVSVKDVLEDVRLSMKGIKGIRNVDWIDSINAFRFTLNNGHTYQLVLQDLKGM